MLVRAILSLKGFVVRIAVLLVRLICWMGRRILLPIAVAFYRLGRSLRRRLLPAERSIALALTHRVLLHVVLIGITLSVASGGVYAQAQNVAPAAENSVLYQYFTGESQLVVESGPPGSASAPVKYLVDAADPNDFGAEPDTDYISESDPTVDDTDEPTDVSSIPGPAGETNRSEIVEYEVQNGDTIYGIAKQFGVSIATVLWENKLSARDFLHPKQKLRILPTSGVTHKIKSGDTVQKIASTYGADSASVLEWNKLGDGSKLSVGDMLIIPDGKPPAPKVVATPKPQKPLASPTDIFTAPLPEPQQPKPASGGNTQLLWPTNSTRVSQYYGHWRRQVGKHTGIDVANNTGSPIYTADDGIVTHAGCGKSCKNGYGYYIDIDHGNGMITRYGHSSKIMVEVGQQVRRGDVIGLIGSTGNSTGPHLHFEVRINGRHVNPITYIR